MIEVDLDFIIKGIERETVNGLCRNGSEGNKG